MLFFMQIFAIDSDGQDSNLEVAGLSTPPSVIFELFTLFSSFKKHAKKLMRYTCSL